jgi:MIP family channel proteins
VEAQTSIVGAPGGPDDRVAVDLAPPRGPAAYVAEFIGTFTLVFFITAIVSLFITPPTPQSPIQPFIDWSVIGLVHAFILFMLIQTLAIVSGAHFNPAVTIALAAIREIRAVDAVIYVVLQLAGGVMGALLTKALLLDEGDAINYGAVAVSDRLDGAIKLGMLAEGVGTFFLVWAIVGVAVNPSGAKDWAGFVIGTTLGALVMVFGPLTGAGFNPARAFGPGLVSGEFGGTGDFLLVYCLAPVIGAILAAGTYFYMFILPGKKGVGGMEPVG